MGLLNLKSQESDALFDEAFMAKLEYLAKDFDTLRFGAREVMSGFSGRKMVPKEFKEQLRRAFNLHLSMEEVKALMAEIDVNKDGYLECHEFILHFFKMAFDARAAERTLELNEIFRRQQIERVKEKEARAERIEAQEREERQEQEQPQAHQEQEQEQEQEQAQ